MKKGWATQRQGRNEGSTWQGRGHSTPGGEVSVGSGGKEDPSCRRAATVV